MYPRVIFCPSFQFSICLVNGHELSLQLGINNLMYFTLEDVFMIPCVSISNGPIFSSGELLIKYRRLLWHWYQPMTADVLPPRPEGPSEAKPLSSLKSDGSDCLFPPANSYFATPTVLLSFLTFPFTRSPFPSLSKINVRSGVWPYSPPHSRGLVQESAPDAPPETEEGGSRFLVHHCQRIDVPKLWHFLCHPRSLLKRSW